DEERDIWVSRGSAVTNPQFWAGRNGAVEPGLADDGAPRGPGWRDRGTERDAARVDRFPADVSILRLRPHPELGGQTLHDHAARGEQRPRRDHLPAGPEGGPVPGRLGVVRVPEHRRRRRVPIPLHATGAVRSAAG